MVTHRLIIDMAATLRRLDIPADLEAWLVDEYGWEAIDGLVKPHELIDAIEARCREYWDGALDATPRCEADLWMGRAETAKYMLRALGMEKAHLLDECARLARLLDENGIDY